MTDPAPSIQKLPPLVINQIAAGEVIERPASAVKELLDNAIDAGATRITVDLDRGGIELVRVTDNGTGIAPDELLLALSAHATSKIRDAEDLDHIMTMGFRGEALASVLSVSRLSVRSRRRDADGASEISGEGDQVGDVRPTPGPHGTCVSVRNLFFNTPARRKFLRTPQTEKNHCMALIQSLAMAHPQIGFIVNSEGKRALDLPAGQSPRDRFIAILGDDIAGELIEIHADGLNDERGVAAWGLVGRPSLARATMKHQHVFLNGRPIKDRTIQHAIKEAYRGLIEPGRYPTAAIVIEMDPSAVDVNVHPAKTEVRFRDSSMVHGAVLGTIRDALRAADLTPTVVSRNEQTSAAWSGRDGGSGVLPTAHAGASHAERPAFGSFLRPSTGSAQERLSYDELRDALSEPKIGVPGAPAHEQLAAAPVPTDPILQVHNSFLVTQDEEGLLIIDQHALHERVMFEQLLEQITSGNLESQRLLVPVIVQVTSRQMSSLEDLAPLMDRLGIDVNPIGPTSIGVQAFPTFLFERGVDAGQFVSELIQRTEEDGFAPGSEEAMHEVLDMMSCKAAIKAGDRMSQGELRRLLELREQVERSSNCPHGRPTSIRLTIRELERRFGRS